MYVCMYVYTYTYVYVYEYTISVFAAVISIIYNISEAVVNQVTRSKYNPGYKGIRSRVRAHQIRGTSASDPGYERIRSGVQG